MGARRKARIIAFQSLYRHELSGACLEDLFDFSWMDSEKGVSPDTLAFARLLIQGALENLPAIDETIRGQLENWDFTRLNKVDLALLRISVYCLMYQQDIPPTVTIDEAVDISKTYGTADSYRFVNGVLDGVRKSFSCRELSPMRRTLLVCLLAVAIVATASLFLLLRRPAAADGDLRKTLAELDSQIAAGYLSTAEDALASLASIRRSEADQLSLLKRALQVSRGTGDFGLLADIAGKALSYWPRSPTIRKVTAYASLRAGRVSDAERILGSAATSGSDGDPLHGEVLLRRGVRWSGSDGLTRELLSLEGRGDPAAYSAAAVAADDKRLALDAALLSMQQGLLEAAARTVRADLDDARFDEVAGLILYDAGDFRAAVQRMKKLDARDPGHASAGLQVADAYSADLDAEESEVWLRRTLPREPALSWTPYANLALYAVRRGDLPGAERLLEDGRAFFPRSRELRFMRARVDIMTGNIRSAEMLLSGLIADLPSDGEAALLLLSLQGPSLSPEASRARLWKLFERVPADTAVFDALASSLVAARDWEGMKIAVRQNGAAGGQPDARLLLLQGFAAAMIGDDEEAAAAFRRAAPLARDGIARFNIALVMLRRGAARAALSELDSAAVEAKDSVVMSRIETLRGAARMLDGDLPGASSALARGLRLDPHNLRAGLLMRKLEAGGQ